MRRVLIGIAILAVGIGVLLYWDRATFPSEGAAKAPELAQLTSFSTPPAFATATGMCPPSPSWAAVMISPASYRGRCVFIHGAANAAPDGSPYVRLDDTVDDQSFWVGWGPGGALTTPGNHCPLVYILGTLQGARNGLPYVVATEGYWGTCSAP
jgi:hypothetical protein